MEKTKTSIFSNALIWFGAAVSIAEILTGTSFASLGMQKGILAIILGHIIGCGLFFLAGLIGAKTERGSMDTVKYSFGEKGSYLFSSLNVLQLVGWTAVMIVSGALAAHQILNLGGHWVWSLIIGALILVWILIGIKNLSKLNIVAMAGLFILTIVLSTVVFSGSAQSGNLTDALSFGAAVELSVAMPLSWLVLISDYTRQAKRKVASTVTSTLVYFFVSSWMYIIGMGAAIFTGESDIAKIMLSAGLGIIGLIIVVLSTVTTTFLDVYSAGVSTTSISKKLSEKKVAIVCCIIGTLIAIFVPTTNFEAFLYLIASVFAPMIAVLITDYFILKNSSLGKTINITNLIIWLIGFFIYRWFMNIDTIVGYTLPVMLIISAICIIVYYIKKLIRK